jgi:Tfp pilus assembly protein PilX
VQAEDREFDPNTVTPGVWGFVITFGIMVVVTLLAIDMTRRIRRTNYRAEVREELAREMAEAELAEAERTNADLPGADAPDASLTGDGPTDASGSAPDDETNPRR